MPAKASPLRRDLSLSLGDSAAFNLMVGLGETYLPAFVLAVGLGEVRSGLIATLPWLAGAVVQLGTPWLERALGSARRCVVLCASLQAAALVPLAWAACSGSASWPLVLCAATLYWGGGLGAAPSWNTWMGVLIPRRLRARYFAARWRSTQPLVLVGILTAGVVLKQFPPATPPLWGFVILFGGAAASRGVSALLLALMREPSAPATGRPGIGVGRALSQHPDAPGRAILFVVAWQLASFLATPFLNAFMLRQLRFDEITYVMMLAAGFVGRTIALGFVGRYAERRGALALLRAAVCSLIPITLLWLLPGGPAYFLLVQFLSGGCQACYDLAIFLLLLEIIRDEERTGVIAVYNVALACAMVGGSVLGGRILAWHGESWAGFALLFCLAPLARLLVLPLLFRLREHRPVPTGVQLEVVTLRPGEGSVESPQP